jgi:hypothetical protein
LRLEFRIVFSERTHENAGGFDFASPPTYRTSPNATARSAQRKVFCIPSCRRKRFELLRGKEELTTYGFNTLTAKHTFCRHCGIHAFYVPRSDPDKFSVNVRCLDDVDLTKIQPDAFDGKHWEEAIRQYVR